MASKKSELDALHELYDGKYGRPRGPLSARDVVASGPASRSAVSASRVDSLLASRPSAGPSFRHAAASHHVNDAYVDDLVEAYDARAAAAGGAGRSSAASGMAARVAAPASGVSRSAPGSSASATSRARLSAASVPAAVASMPGRPARPVAWRTGPVDASGYLVDLSERPNLCMAVSPTGREVVVGSSDHALYVIDTDKRARSRTLYGKRAGHTEWVTGVTYLADGSGRIASCGMDGKIVVWGAGGTARRGADPPTVELLGHFGSVSQVDALPGSSLLLSSGYDKTVRLWNADGASCLAEMRGHAAPVLQQAIRGAPAAGDACLPGAAGAPATALPAITVATGDRDGVVRVWDGEKGACTATLAGHKGHITSLAWLTPHAGWSPGLASAASVDGGAGSGGEGSRAVPTHADILLSGAQDGHLRAWDLRAKTPLANIELHASAAGAGAVGGIAVAHVPTSPAGGAAAGAGASTETLVVTAGADRCVCVLDPRRGFAPRFRMAEHADFIYSLFVVGGVSLSGSGSGMLLAHDLATGKPLWGLGANEAAVRCVAAVGGNQLVATGDDGKALIYDFDWA